MRNSGSPLNAAEKLIDRMRVFSSFRPEQVPEYMKAFSRMLNEFGEDRTNRGLTMAIDAIPGFPPTPAEIRRYIPTVTPTTVRCDDECKRKHGRGYGTGDISWLLKRRMAEQGKSWTLEKWEALMKELDSKREGGAPVFRRTA